MSFARSSAWLVLLLGIWSTPPMARAQDPALTIDGRHSSARFIVHMLWRMRVEGQLSRISGQLTGSAASGWKVLVKADGRSLRVQGPRWIDRATRSDDFLAVDRYPAIRFESEHFSDAALHAGGPLSGELTLRGLTRRVSFRLEPSTCRQPGRDCDIEVNGSISRHDFGMTAHKATVRDDVQFNMRVRLRPPGPAP